MVHSLTAEPHWQLQRLKLRVKALTGIPCRRQILVYDGQLVDDDSRTLHQASLCVGSGYIFLFDTATLPLTRKRVRDELPDSAAALAARRVAGRTAAVRLHDYAVDSFGVLTLPELEGLLHQVRRLPALCDSDALLP